MTDATTVFATSEILNIREKSEEREEGSGSGEKFHGNKVGFVCMEHRRRIEKSVRACTPIDETAKTRHQPTIRGLR